jgi:hypothetical protein
MSPFVTREPSDVESSYDQLADSRDDRTECGQSHPLRSRRGGARLEEGSPVSSPPRRSFQLRTVAAVTFISEVCFGTQELRDETPELHRTVPQSTRSTFERLSKLVQRGRRAGSTPPGAVASGWRPTDLHALRLQEPGGVAERFNAPVLKTGGRKPTWVRIPPPPFEMPSAEFRLFHSSEFSSRIRVGLLATWLSSGFELSDGSGYLAAVQCDRRSARPLCPARDSCTPASRG